VFTGNPRQSQSHPTSQMRERVIAEPVELLPSRPELASPRDFVMFRSDETS
jgi:hypothetical protein